MDHSNLELEFLWRPNRKELAVVKEFLREKENNNDIHKPTGPLLNFKNCLKKITDFPIQISNCSKYIVPDTEETVLDKHQIKNLFHLEFLFDVIVNLNIEKDPSKDLRQFIERLCSSSKQSFNYDVYLKLPTNVFTIQDDLITTSEPTELTRFSLGNMVGLNTFRERFNSATSIQGNDYKITQVRLEMLHDYKKLILYFVVGKVCRVKKRNASTHLLHKLEVYYSNVNSVIISKKDGLTVYFKMLQPPLMYAVDEDRDPEDDYVSFHQLDGRTHWLRTLSLFDGAPPHLLREFTMNTVLSLNFKTENYNSLFPLKSHGKGIQFYFAPVTVVNNGSNSTQLQLPLKDFECYYAMQCLFTQSFEVIDQIVIQQEEEELKQLLVKKCEENPRTLSTAIYCISDALSKGYVVMFRDCLEHLCSTLPAKDPNNGKDPKKVVEDFSSAGGHLVIVRCAVLLPTHVQYLQPRPGLKSRILRDCDPDYALRVNIRDVNGVKLSMTIRASGNTFQKEQDFFNKYIKKTLLKGIHLEKRCYKYVGSSTSQLKGHGLWLYAQDREGKTADSIRMQMGRFDEIKSVSKYMARMGQSFSQSMGNIDVPQEWTNIKDPEEDVKGGVVKYMVLKEPSKPMSFLKEVSEENEEDEGGEPYVFSDGVGRISPELMEEVYKVLKLDFRPSAIQIRYAGCKGMLVVDPQLTGKKILFRKSMKKYESDHTSLEIIKYSKQRPAFFNRPFITILEQLGVRKEAFLKLQKGMIQSHITSMFHNQEASQFLNRNSLLRFKFERMYEAGISFTADPLFRSMIYALFRKNIELLKNKANIEIPIDKGRNMFGLIDDTKTLEYGQVFVQYTKWYTGKYKVVEGTVVVTKNPCMHPGDVRKFEAVDVPGLHHIVDCIVFPAKGPRPHPDEMAGSDLDGDEYHVMWLKEMEFPQENFPPMHFQQRKDPDVEEKKGAISVSDQLDHLCNFIFGDKVGIIATNHLVLSDYIKDGIYNDTCLHLANLYSLALDFGKSGKPVPRFYARPDKYPDFMQKLNERATYLSVNTLGVLFRSCKRLELGFETEKVNFDFELDTHLIHPRWEEKYKKSAVRVYKRYCNRVEYFLSMYGFENEGQLLAGAILNPPKYYEDRNDLNNLNALLEFEVAYIFRDLQMKFFEEFGGKPLDEEFTDKMLQKASAWYMVAYDKSANENSAGPACFGLPWAVYDVLIALKLRNSVVPVTTNSRLEETVDKSVSRHFPSLTPDTDSQFIYDNRIDVLDVGTRILRRWVKSQREFFSDPNMRQVQAFVDKQFDQVTAFILACDWKYIDGLKQRHEIKKVISPCYQVVETLLNISKIGAAEMQDTRTINIQQEVGLLAWITLIKLACSYNPQYLAIPNEAGEYKKTIFYRSQDNITDTIQLPLFDHKSEANVLFSKMVTCDFSVVKQFLMSETQLKGIECRPVKRPDGTEYMRFTVRGSRYSIERLKDIVVMDDFFTAVIENKPLFQA